MTMLSNIEQSDPDEEVTATRRREVVEAAAQLLADHGPRGLTMRSVAATVGGSTQIVYSLFGSKSGLADAVYAEGFARLAATADAALATHAAGDPDRLLAHGLAYCDFARRSPTLFAVMFGRAVPGFTPRRETKQRCRAMTLGRVAETAQECVDAATLEADDVDALAHACWCTAHGVASLLVSGHLPDDPAAITALLRVPIRAHLPHSR